MSKDFLPVPKPTSEKKKGGASPRRAGAKAERIAAKQFGGTRTPMSGAIKNSVHNLTGDVELPDANGKPLVKLEVKYSGTIDTRGGKSFALAKSVLEQMRDEADRAGEIGALNLRFKGDPTEESWIIMAASHWQRFLDLAKLGSTL